MAEHTITTSQNDRLVGVVERITFTNPQNGWTVLRVSQFRDPSKLVTVVLHQAHVFAGSTMEFLGAWKTHPQHGEQFVAHTALEKKPASTAALEKYLGSGLIKGVGPKTAAKIVRHFKEGTLRVFEEQIDDLLHVPGIAEKKLQDIKTSWSEHKAIRDVMLFLQHYGISSIFAVKIFKAYGNQAISIVTEDPYRLARDIYGIGFFSADRIALSMGYAKDSTMRILAGIKHVLAASRDEGHCYLTESQVVSATLELLDLAKPESITQGIDTLLLQNEIASRTLGEPAYYSKSLYYDEAYVAERVRSWLKRPQVCEEERVAAWVDRYCDKHTLKLSLQQRQAVSGIAGSAFSILTGGPGCGKTTTTRVLARLIKAMNKRLTLCAPTGRAAQRMSEVIGHEAKTIHRLLEVDGKGGFKKNEDCPLETDFLIVDECSMLDIQLAAALFKAVPHNAQLLLIGDPDQLPSVGAGNVLFDLLSTKAQRFGLTQVFRQAEESLVIRYAHQINKGEVPRIQSPLHDPKLWTEQSTCLFIDAEEATLEQLRFVQRAKAVVQHTKDTGETQLIQQSDAVSHQLHRVEDAVKLDALLVQSFEGPEEIRAPLFVIPQQFRHVDLLEVSRASADFEKLQAILRTIHPWSALHYNMTALDVIVRLCTKTIKEHYGDLEVQLLTPQLRGSLGANNLNQSLQAASNPLQDGQKELHQGDRIFREGDRVIQTRNNYDLNVYNGDIGKIVAIDVEASEIAVNFQKPEPVIYKRDDLVELKLAYAITIHKSQGSEFDAVIIPVTTQAYKMLFRNLIYTALTRAKKLCIFVGSRKALALAVQQSDTRLRQTALTQLIDAASSTGTSFNEAFE